MLRLFAGVLSLLLCQSAAAQWGQSGVKVPKQSDEKPAAAQQPAQMPVQRWAKVRCPGVKQPRPLFSAPDSLQSMGEVKCGTNVAVLAFDAGHWHVRVDGKEGYLLEDAIESREQAHERKRRQWNRAAEIIRQSSENFARGLDPHIAWCDDHGGFHSRDRKVKGYVGAGYDLSGYPIPAYVEITRTYVVCKDGRRFLEREQ